MNFAGISLLLVSSDNSSPSELLELKDRKEAYNEYVRLHQSAPRQLEQLYRDAGIVCLRCFADPSNLVVTVARDGARWRAMAGRRYGNCRDRRSSS